SHTRRTQPHTATHNTPHTATEDLTPPPPPPLARCRRLTYAPPSSPSAPSPLSAPSPVRAGTIPAVAVRASRAVPVVPCPPRHRPLPCCGDGARDSGSRAAGCCGDGAREPPAGCCGDTAPSRELCCRACSRGSREGAFYSSLSLLSLMGDHLAEKTNCTSRAWYALGMWRFWMVPVATSSLMV
ncbi:unnamed protein product, partial [Urochloa humidicola]